MPAFLPRRRLLLAAVAAAMASRRPARAVAADPTRFVEQAARRAIAVLERTDLDREAKIAALEQLVEDVTDLPLVVRLVLGRYWREATPEQRERLLDLARRFLRKLLAERLDSYAGQQIEVVEAQPVDEQDIIVRTRVVSPREERAYTVDWRVRRLADGRLVIVDVIAEGVSFVFTQRSEISEIVSRAGIDGLIAEYERRLSSAS